MKVHEMDADIIGWCINYEQTSGKHLLSREGNTIPRCATNPTQLDLSQSQLDERSQACHLKNIAHGPVAITMDVGREQ